MIQVYMYCVEAGCRLNASILWLIQETIQNSEMLLAESKCATVFFLLFLQINVAIVMVCICHQLGCQVRKTVHVHNTGSTRPTICLAQISFTYSCTSYLTNGFNIDSRCHY